LAALLAGGLLEWQADVAHVETNTERKRARMKAF
jgi:hypothetical protein